MKTEEKCIVETSGSASRSIMIALESYQMEQLTLLARRSLEELVEGRNLTTIYYSRPYRQVAIGDVRKIKTLVQEKIESLKLKITARHIEDTREVLFDVLKDSIKVKDFPMEALTCPLEEVGIPRKVLNPLMQDGMTHLFHLVRETEKSIMYKKQMGESRTKELRDCLHACNLELLGWPNGPDFLSRDLKFIDFYTKNHPNGRSIIV